MSEFVRLNVNVNEDTANALRQIAKDQGVSITEAVRRCISLYHFLDTERSQGREIVIRDHYAREDRIVTRF